MLDNFSVKVLRYIKKHPNVKADDIKNAFSSDCNANIECLCKENYITCKTEYLSLTPLPKYDNSYKITPKGISYLEELPKNRFYRIYPPYYLNTCIANITYCTIEIFWNYIQLKLIINTITDTIKDIVETMHDTIS